MGKHKGWRVSLGGVVLILLGLLLPSQVLISTLRETRSESLSQDLLLGAQLFRLGLVLLGCASLVLTRVWGGSWERARLTPTGPRWSWFLLGGILLASFGLRLYRLDIGLWHDEVITYVNYVSMPLGEIFSTYRDQNQHFLFSILARLSMEIFGDSASSLRLPAVLFGVGSIFALYLFASRFTSSTEALLSASLLAFSYHHVWFSQNARGYSGLLFWALLASWAFVAAQQDSNRRLWLLYAVFCALGVYTHMSMLFMIVAHYATYTLQAVRDPRKRRLAMHRDFLISVILTGLLIFQLHALVLPQILHHGNEVSTVPAWKNPLWAVYEFVTALQVSFSSGMVVAAALAVFALGAWDLARRQREVIYFLVIPCALTAAVVIASGHHLWPRFFFFAFGFMCMVVIRGVFRAVSTGVWILRMPLRWLPVLQASACILLILMSASSIRNAYAPKQDFLGALNYVQSQLTAGDAVATVGLAGFTYEKLYRKPWPGLQSLDELNALRARSSRTWLIYTFPPEVRAVYPGVMEAVDRDFETVRVFPGSVGSGAVFVCRSNSLRHATLTAKGS